MIVFNFPHYSNIPDLTALYKNAFPTIMFCGSEKATGEHTVEALDIHKGYFGYLCMSRAMQKHPGYSGYLLVGDDVILNYWNLVGLNRDHMWEGPKAPKGMLQFQTGGQNQHQTWYWWDTQWGRQACQKTLNEIKALSERLSEKIDNHKDEHGNQLTMVFNVIKAITSLKRNGNGQVYCHKGRSDVFYIPGRFADAFTKLSDIFYKYRTFLEIAVPTIFRMTDLQESFEYIPGIYLATHPEEGTAENFWDLYNKKLAFLHPLKLNAKANGALNSRLLRRRIIEYSDSLSNC